MWKMIFVQIIGMQEIYVSMKKYFRFMDLQIWQDGMAISDKLEPIADRMEELRKFRHAEQLRAACLSITINIAEGAGSSGNKEFALFLNYARRSVFECANVILYFNRHQLLRDEECEILCGELMILSQKIHNIRKQLAIQA